MSLLFKPSNRVSDHSYTRIHVDTGEPAPPQSDTLRTFPATLLISEKTPSTFVYNKMKSIQVRFPLVQIGWTTPTEFKNAHASFSPTDGAIVVFTVATGWCAPPVNVAMETDHILPHIEDCIYGKVPNSTVDAFEGLLHDDLRSALFVLFTQPSCPHCVTTKKEFFRLRDILTHTHPGLLTNRCFVVDITLHPKYTDLLRIDRVPAIFYRPEGGDMVPFTGLPRNAENMHRFIQQLTF